MDVRPLLTDVMMLTGDLVPRLQALRYDVTWKPDGSPVTQADILMETELGDFLKSRLPGVRVIGEETFQDADDQSPEGWIAVVDPIDGTENFCSGLPEWGVALTLWKDGAHAGSLLQLPEMGRHLMTGDTPPLLRSRIVGVSSTLKNETLGVLDTLIADGKAAQPPSDPEARILGCAVYNLYNVARGALARFVNPRGAYSWDLLAGVMLALENRCDVEIDGKPYDGHYLQAGRRHRVDIRHRYDLHPGQGPIG
ncbi:hypothetical protein ASG17_00510 [Brevundimonas sp. Leaf363]|uniref:inositol monophosphatase family protein n=1 Tax=Brevundimonas sp. Leaf363 TaxID=1736353 RepID=UPI0006F9E59E|nr:inositol monophosphatase family protein [Brevundimonas sp. Leaf363]KQS57256.1 hypothetical protein ASG17_00510 [Brevundimonas sp. Leaf363]